MTTPPTVAVLGLGNLGRAIASTLLQSRHTVVVWNRTHDRAADLVARGATVARTAAKAVAAADLVVIALLDPAAAGSVLDSTGDVVGGRTLVNLTSGAPKDAIALARWATDRRANYVHGAVYAVPQTIGTAESAVSYSGSPDGYARWKSILDHLGTGTFLGPEPSQASGQDVAILAGMYGMLGGFLHAMSLAPAAGVSASELTPRLVSWLTDAFAVLPTFADEIDTQSYATQESNLAMNQTGLATIIGASESQGVPATLLLALKGLVDSQVAAGHGGASLSRAVESLKVNT